MFLFKFGPILIFLGLICQLIESAHLNIDNMDRESLLSLLADAGVDPEDDDVASVVNAIPERQPQSRPVASRDVDLVITKPNPSSILAPKIELLHLVESFLKLKGEMVARIYALINDNWELLRSIFNLVLFKVGKLHSFTLYGIHVFRRICEFALQLVGTWELNAPPTFNIDIEKLFHA